MRRLEYYNNQPREFISDLVFRDGRVVDLIRDERDGLAKFIVWNPNTSTAEATNFIGRGKILVMPMDRPEDWIRMVRLPNGADVTGELQSLVDDIRRIFQPMGKTI